MKKKSKSNKPASRTLAPKPKSDLFDSKFWRLNSIPAIILFALGIGLYISTVSFEYVLDDQIVITDNAYTNKGLGGIGDIFSHESFVGYFGEKKDLVAGARYRPLSIATFAIEREFFQKPKDDGYGNLVKDQNGNQAYSGNPAISHFINVLLYALTGLILYRVLCLFFPVSSRDRWYFSIPFTATLLFIVHPVHTEVVANIKGRDEILSLLFSLGALYCSLRYLAQCKFIWLVTSCISYFLGLLAKENAITFLAIIPLAAYFFTKEEKKVILKATLPLLITTFIYVVIRFRVIGYLVNNTVITDIMNNPFYGLSFDQKLATTFYTLGLYIKLLFIPHPLTHDYYPYAIPIMDFSNWQPIVSVVLYAVLGWIAVRGLKNKSVVSFSILFYLITLSIVSNILISVGSFMNERFIYMSSIGFCIALAYLLLHKLPETVAKYSQQARLAGVCIVVVIGVLYSYTTLARNPAWKNSYALNDADISTSSNSCNVNCFRGVALYKKYTVEKDDKKKQQLIHDADSFLLKALNIFPNYGSALQMYSGVITEEFRYHQDVNRLLNEFYWIIERKDDLDFVDQYLEYLNKKGMYTNQLVTFYHRAGFEMLYQRKQKSDHAKKYIQWGLQLDPFNQVLKDDLQQIGNL